MIKKYVILTTVLLLGSTQANSMSWFKRTPKQKTTNIEEPKPEVFKPKYSSLCDTLKRCPINNPECLDAFEHYKDQINNDKDQTNNVAHTDCQFFSNNGYKPLHKAILKRRSLREIERLVELGADVNSKSGILDFTPLHITTATFNGAEDLAIAKYLIEKGADVNQTAKHNTGTPLTLSACSKEPQMTKLLLDHGAYIHPMNIEGDTALQVAAQCSTKPMAKVLVEYGADVNDRNPFNGKTPLHNAVRDPRIAKYLIKHGANPYAFDKNWQTPVSIAVKKGDLRTAANMVGWSLMKDYTDNKKDFYAPSFID